MRRAVITLLIFLLLCVTVVASYMAVKEYRQYEAAAEHYEKLQDEFVETKTTEETTPDETTEPTEPIEVAPITIDFASLLEQNSDVVGWIYCQDTPINYPVVQAKDNDKYLRRDLNGKYLVSGTVFVDYRNGAIGEDANYIVYGHNMKDGTMFSSLSKYKEQSYYDEHPVLYFLTPTGDYKIELYAGIVVKRDALIYMPNPDEKGFAEFLSNAKEKSTFKSEVEITENDTLITLSTCSYEYNHARYIVIGKLNKL